MRSPRAIYTPCRYPLVRGAGMGAGGAFIAVADDATAASWNPGALMTLLIKSLKTN